MQFLKSLTVFVAAILSLTLSRAQEIPPPVTLAWGGFVRTDAAFDTRMNAESREGFFIFFPKAPEHDALGQDIHQRAGFNQWAMTTRLFAKATGPTVLNAASMAMIEGDFTGPSNIENHAFRLRHAYITLKWKNSLLLMGQYWTPLDLPEALPRPLALNTGAPFHSFTRSPQIRFEQQAGKWKAVLAALSQRDYPSPGPSGMSVDYQRRALIPNLHLQIHYTHHKTLAGLGADLKYLSPRLTTDSNWVTHEKISSMSLMAFLKTESKNFQWKSQAILGQNLPDHLMAGGYAVETIDTVTGVYDYINLRHLFLWADLTYRTGNLRWGLFAGFFENMGTSRPAYPIFYGRGADIARAFRLSPRIDWELSPLLLSFEIEYTWAGYGHPDERYKPMDIKGVENLRLQAAATYNF